jgi:Acyclic terpene utilisation family protein AtuA
VSPLRIANCSGFFGDRLSAAREMVDGGPIDVLTGDWLAELTMLILARQRQRQPGGGYARTFLRQMEDVLGTCLERGIKVVSNAGGLDPASCASALHELAERLGLQPRIAHVQGDDLLPRLDELRRGGETFEHFETGEPLTATPSTANAYLGGFGIAAALTHGADVVITGRVTDAALVVGPAVWRYGWSSEAWDQLAGAVVVGHILECGAQATGGNYAFFQDVPGIEHCGFPLAELSDDGSAVITKHPNTGGLVSLGTVTAQLLYEIGSPAYANPDVVARFDTILLEQDGADRVRVSGIRGEPPPRRLKVGLTFSGGFRNSMTFVLIGLDPEAKAAVGLRTLWSAFPSGSDYFDSVAVDLHGDQLRVTVKDRHEAKVGRAFSSRVVEMALASYPGFFTTTPPGDASPYGVFWPTSVCAAKVPQRVFLEGALVAEVLPSASGRGCRAAAGEGDRADASPHPAFFRPLPEGEVVRVPLGRLAGARSGDKAGNANVGVWVTSDDAYAWLAATLTIEYFKQLLPEARQLQVDRFELPNLHALNFVVHGLLGRGVADSTRYDPQAKSLGELLRAQLVEVPSALLR